jgi:bifunctional DNA-binding transcriptional regulator/antitoxin component of YhaV-PrlF toxin-antitoxin module
MDFAYFAVKLGWSIDQYEATTPVQRAFIRKEIERQTVDMSELVADATEIAIANAHRKRRRRFKLWRKKRGGSERPPISKKEMSALREELKRNTPWSPWRGVGNG